MNRDERLYPRWPGPSYCVLTKLRQAIEEIIARHLVPADSASQKGIAIDLGCGNMPYGPLLEQCVARYMGVDFSGNDRADLHFDPGTFKVPLPEHSAKIIISTQVLEHVPDPNAYLSEAKRLLKPDGLMILSTHGYWQEHPDPHDYWRWTSEGLMKLLRDNGWYVMEFIGVLGFASMALQLFQQAIMPKVPRALSKAFVMLMQLCVLCADSFYSAKSRLHNACVFVVAAKPARE